MIGSFSAVASTSGIWNGQPSTPAALRPLPPAVLVHVGHSLEARIAGPVGVAVPSFVDGRILVHAVLASTSREASDLIRSGHLAAVSIVAWFNPVRHWRDLGRMTLAAADLVDVPADRNALIDRVTYVNSMFEGQRRTREAFDAYLSDDSNPRQLDFRSRFDEVGIAAFDPLGPVVSGLESVGGLSTSGRLEMVAHSASPGGR